jgi:hypothetical protein
LGSFAVLVLLAATPHLDAATMTYFNDFSGTGSNTDLPTETTASGQSWTVTSGVYRYMNTNTTGGGIASSASIPITNAATEPFPIVQTQFVVSGIGVPQTGSGDTLGFGLFGLDAAFTGAIASNAYYLADFAYARGATSGTVDGQLRILSLGDGTGFASITGVADDNASATLAVVPGATYTLRLTGSYTGPTLNLTLGVFNASGIQIGTSATASDTSPLAGTHFGFRNRTPIGGGTVTINFDDFLIMPEPAAALAALGLAIFAMRRRSNPNDRRFVA